MADFNLSQAVSGLAGGAADFVLFNAETARAETLERLRAKNRRELQREGISQRAGEDLAKQRREQEFERETTGLANEEALRRFEREADLQRELTGVKETGRAERAAAQQAAIESRFLRKEAGEDRRAGVAVGETAFQKETGKALAKTVADQVNQGNKAVETIGTLNRAETLIDQSGTTGRGSRIVSGIKSFGAMLGFTPKQIDSAITFGPETGFGDALAAMQTNLALGQVGQTKGQISNYEMALFLQSVPGLDNTREGNIIILRAMRAIAERQQDVGRIAGLLQDGRISREQYRQQIDDLGPAFSEDLEARMRNTERLRGLSEDEIANLGFDVESPQQTAPTADTGNTIRLTADDLAGTNRRPGLYDRTTGMRIGD